MAEETAMLIVYTGNGKGKTSASVGQAVRALGQGFKVVFGQFMKRPGQAGEQKILGDLLGEDFRAGGLGFFRKEEERAEHAAVALELLNWALGRVAQAGMLVLDESLYALGHGLISRQDLEKVIAACEDTGAHLVLSGRGAPDWLVERADLVTEMGEKKHPYAAGVTAVRGVEF